MHSLLERPIRFSPQEKKLFPASAHLQRKDEAGGIARSKHGIRPSSV
jgi:hypothetical protein